MKNNYHKQSKNRAGAPYGNTNAVTHGRFTAAAKSERKRLQKSIREMNQILEDISKLTGDQLCFQKM